MRKYKKLLSVICCFVIMAAFAIPAFAVDSSSVASEAVSAMSEGFQQVTSTISIGNILQVLTIVLGFLLFLVGHQEGYQSCYQIFQER